MSLKCLFLLGVLVLLQTVVPRTDALPAAQEGNYGSQNVGNSRKKAFVVVLAGDQTITWEQARRNCQSRVRGGDIFSVDNAGDSTWLGQRINYEKENTYRNPAKFWVGLLNNVSPNNYGSMYWTSGADYYRYPEVVGTPDTEDSTKRWAWAVPDGPVNKLKYEFNTHDEVAEAYICQHY